MQRNASAFKVWHGIAGAELLRTKFGVMDMDVLSAVRYHTIARAGMSDLEKIVYLADMISVERDYPDVETMRKKALESLDEGMGYALKYSLMKLVRRERTDPAPHRRSIQRNFEQATPAGRMIIADEQKKPLG